METKWQSIKVSPHRYMIGLSDAQKLYTQRLAQGMPFSVVSHFGAITAPEFNSISVVRMCEMSRGM